MGYPPEGRGDVAARHVAHQAIAILGFAWLASAGPQGVIGAGQRVALAWVIGIEALGVGLGTAAFVAFIARSTHPVYTATQFALFTSLAAVPRTFINASAGWLVEQMGWFGFFLLCAVLAVPGMVLLLKVAPWRREAAVPRSAFSRGRSLHVRPSSAETARAGGSP